MKSRRFFRNVFLPAFLLLIIIAAGKAFSLSFMNRWVTAVLLITSAVFYLRKLNLYWGYPADLTTEVRRFKILIWLVLLQFPLDLILFFNISISHVNPSLVWTYLFTSGITLFSFLTLLLQIFRFSAEINLKSFRVILGLAIVSLMIFTGWNDRLQFLIAFALVVWIFKFESSAELKTRRKLVLLFTCLVGFFFLIISSANVSASANSSGVVLGGVTISASAVNSIEILKSRLLPLFPNFISGLRHILLALFIVLPAKVFLRPIADWLKFSLRIRTKLALSYVFSSIIPGILLVVILLFGLLFMTGAFWQIFTSGIVEGRTDTLEALWNSGVLSEEDNAHRFDFQAERYISEYLKTNGISVVFVDINPGGKLERARYGGAALPNLSGGDSLTIEVIEEVITKKLKGDQIITFRTKSPVFHLPGMLIPHEIGNDSLIIGLGKDNFAGITWFEETPYFTRWMLAGDKVIGLFQPFTLGDLNEMKVRCGSDLQLILAGDIKTNDFTDGTVNINFGSSLKPILETRQQQPERAALDIPISFPTLISSLSWGEETGFEDSDSIMLVQTSLYSVFGVLFSGEHLVNRVYIAVFAILAGFFGMILMLVALIGFGLAGGITRSIAKIRKGTQQIRNGDLNANIQLKTRDELGELAGSFNLMTADLKEMLEEVKEKERLEGELEAAKAIQMKLLPEKVPCIAGFDIAATSLPAKQVGGDYYDFIELPENKLGFAVGDVSGKGMPAALLMANLQASLRTLAQSNLPLEVLVGRLNTALHDNTSPEMFATFFFASLNSDQNRLSYVNAGHNFPILCGNGRLEQLSEGGLLLGVVPECRYASGCVTLEPGEIIVLYSDGITEATNGDDEEYGEERFIRLLQNQCNLSADDILNVVMEEVKSYCGAPQDDMTLLVIKRIAS